MRLSKKTQNILEKARKPKVNFVKLRPGIINGEFQLPVGSRFVVKRTRNERKIMSYCILKEVSQNGDVTMWDETVTQFFSFNVHLLDDVDVRIET